MFHQPPETAAAAAADGAAADEASAELLAPREAVVCGTGLAAGVADGTGPFGSRSLGGLCPEEEDEEADGTLKADLEGAVGTGLGCLLSRGDTEDRAVTGEEAGAAPLS